jgi:hypothetical membrane protein
MTAIMSHRVVKLYMRTSWLALGAIVGPALFVLAWLALGFVRPGYSIVRQSVSALGIGQDSALMNTAIVIGALLLFVGVVGVVRSMRADVGVAERRLCTIMLVLPAVGMLWVGIFHMNRILLHTIGAGLAFGAPVPAFLAVGLILRRAPGWRSIGNWLVVASPLTMALLIGFITSAPLSVLQSVAGGKLLGLWERALILEVLLWYAVLGWRALHDRRQAPRTCAARKQDPELSPAASLMPRGSQALVDQAVQDRFSADPAEVEVRGAALLDPGASRSSAYQPDPDVSAGLTWRWQDGMQKDPAGLHET